MFCTHSFSPLAASTLWYHWWDKWTCFSCGAKADLNAVSHHRQNLNLQRCFQSKSLFEVFVSFPQFQSTKNLCIQSTFVLHCVHFFSPLWTWWRLTSNKELVFTSRTNPAAGGNSHCLHTSSHEVCRHECIIQIRRRCLEGAWEKFWGNISHKALSHSHSTLISSKYKHWANKWKPQKFRGQWLDGLWPPSSYSQEAQKWLR